MQKLISKIVDECSDYNPGKKLMKHLWLWSSSGTDVFVITPVLSDFVFGNIVLFVFQ
jgi:hypothetical protein